MDELFRSLLTGEASATVIAVLVFGTVALGAYGLMTLTATRGLMGGRRNALVPSTPGVSDPSSSPLWNRLDTLGRRLGNPSNRMSALGRELVQAGYLHPEAVARYNLARIALAVGLPAAFLLAVPLILGEMPGGMVFLVGAALVGIGLYVPGVWLDIRKHSRQQHYREAFPDLLDLLVVCVEAGLGIDAAFGRVAREMQRTNPQLGYNLIVLEVELRAGGTRSEALRHLADRLGIDEVRSLVTLLNQSDELGTSIADALRVYSVEMRTHRLLRAETKASSLPVKLTIPLALFVFPTMLTVIMLPLVIRMVGTKF